MMILKDGSVYPPPSLKAFRAEQMARDCPLGTLRGCGVRGLVPFAVIGSEILTIVPESVFDLSYCLAETEQSLHVHCAYGHIGECQLEIRGGLKRIAESLRVEVLQTLVEIHPEYAGKQGSAVVRLVPEHIDYYGSLSESGSVDVELFSDISIRDDREHFPRVCQAFNSLPTVALIRVARHYLRILPRVQQASLVRVDSYGMTIKAENGFDTMFLRLTFPKKATTEQAASEQLQECIAPGHDRRCWERFQQRSGGGRSFQQLLDSIDGCATWPVKSDIEVEVGQHDGPPGSPQTGP